MAKLLVREVAEREGIRNALALATKAGIPYASVHRLWLGTAKMIGLDTIERLCRALSVRPGQLFELESELSLPAAGSKAKAAQRRRKR
ncbi:MAG: XRE family transcriptional regulator [Blastocatellia bacterium AA13]|nr:MAG: XRE family transcriptional regulator [Blastocatellia bacterium AA13]